MSNWKAERDAFVSETMAFVEAVRSQRPISTEAIVTPKQLPVGVPEHIQQPVPTVSEHAHVVSDETVGQPRLEPMKWGGSEREEIRKRIATFKANQQRFTREREDYALSTLMRVQGTSALLIRMHPNLRRDLALHSQLEHVHWRRVSARPATPEF